MGDVIPYNARYKRTIAVDMITDIICNLIISKLWINTGEIIQGQVRKTWEKKVIISINCKHLLCSGYREKNSLPYEYCLCYHIMTVNLYTDFDNI